MEEKNNVQIDPNDTITWIKYEIRGQPTKHSNIPEDLQTKAIGSDDAMIIVEKHKKSMYCMSISLFINRDTWLC